MHTSLFSAGNMSFRRDLVNQGEQAVSNVMTAFKTGAFATSAATQADNAALNYSSTALATNAQGVPNALLNQTAFNAVGLAANDITGATPEVKIRYVIDRLCSVTGPSFGTHVRPVIRRPHWRHGSQQRSAATQRDGLSPERACRRCPQHRDIPANHLYQARLTRHPVMNRTISTGYREVVKRGAAMLGGIFRSARTGDARRRRSSPLPWPTSRFSPAPTCRATWR